MQIEDGAVPVVHPPRRVPVALKPLLIVKEDLRKLQDVEIIAPITEPTPWVSSMVTVKNPNGRLRICLDPKDLNRVVKRSHYPLPTMEELLPELTKAKVFSTFDVKNGFWHIPLDEAFQAQSSQPSARLLGNTDGFACHSRCLLPRKSSKDVNIKQWSDFRWCFQSSMSSWYMEK